jgi:hypothetical protein
MKSKQAPILAIAIALLLLSGCVLLVVGAAFAGYNPVKLLLGIPDHPKRPHVIPMGTPSALRLGGVPGDAGLFICRNQITLGNIGALPETLQAVTLSIGMASDQPTMLRLASRPTRWKSDKVELVANVWHTKPLPLSSYEDIDILEGAEYLEAQRLPAQISGHGTLDVFIDIVGAFQQGAPESINLDFLFEFSEIRPLSVGGVHCSP